MKSQPLFKHQKASIKFLKTRSYVFDMSDPGTGKTRVHIEDFAQRRKAGGGPALVIATKSILRSAWGNDLNKFAPNLTYAVASANVRLEAMNEDVDVYIINHDGVKDLLKLKPAFWNKFKNGTLIIDESTAFKHHTSARAKAAKKIASKFAWRRLLSGTPSPKGVLDLWHQMFILDDGVRLGKSFFQFRNATCDVEQVGPAASMVRWVERPNIKAVVSAMLQDITIRHKLEECTDIPPNNEYSVPYDLPKKHRAAYLQLEEASLLELKNTTITAINGGVLYQKLLQAASGAVYSDDGAYAVLDTGRYELVIDLVMARDHSVTFFNWKHQRDELIKLAEKNDIRFAVIDGSVTSDKKRLQICEDFQKGYYQTIFAHPQSAGHGLTLTKGTATIWASPTRNLEHYLQGLRRVYRISQTKNTETIVVVAPGTVDEVAFADMLAKNEREQKFLSFLTSRLGALNG